MTARYQGYQRLQFDYPRHRVLRIRIHRPEKLGALDARGHRELTYVWNEVDADPDIDCVILTGSGRAFSAGGDFEMVEALTRDFDTRATVWKEARDLVYNLINCGKPTISAINGTAVGAGLVAALLCDISIAAESVRLSDGHTRLGVAAGDHAAIIWPLLCGMAKAKYYLLTCEPLPAPEAERIGLISRCVPDAELEAEALQLAERLQQGAPSAIRWTKYAMNGWLRQAGPIFDTSTALEILGFTGPEAAEGLASLQQKRPPDFPEGSPI
jgi:enoyl-CoA hydratase